MPVAKRRLVGHGLTCLLILGLIACEAPAPQSKSADEPPSGIDQAKFEDLYRSAKTLEATTGVGVNFRKFGTLIQALATEVSIGQDKASSSEEADLVSLYGTALAVYRDSQTLWKQKIRFSKISYGQIRYDPAMDFGLGAIIEKYGIQLMSREEPIAMTLIPSASIQELWARGQAELKKANKLYWGN